MWIDTLAREWYMRSEFVVYWTLVQSYLMQPVWESVILCIQIVNSSILHWAGNYNKYLRVSLKITVSKYKNMTCLVKPLVLMHDYNTFGCILPKTKVLKGWWGLMETKFTRWDWGQFFIHHVCLHDFKCVIRIYKICRSNFVFKIIVVSTFIYTGTSGWACIKTGIEINNLYALREEWYKVKKGLSIFEYWTSIGLHTFNCLQHRKLWYY